MAETSTFTVPAHAAALPAILRRTRDFLKPHVGFVAVLAFAACFLSPILRSGFCFDDDWSCALSGYLFVNDKSLTDFIQGSIWDWMWVNGRFFPLALIACESAYFVFTDVLIYKCYILSLVLSNLLLFYVLLRRWNVSHAAAQLGTLSLVLLMQMRLFPDPLLAFTGLMQILTGQLLLSMIGLQEFLRTQRHGWLIVSLLCYVSALLTYEISYLFLPIYLTQTYVHYRRWRPALAAISRHALVLLPLFVLVAGLRSNLLLDDQNAYRASWLPGEICETTLRQASAALPASYALLSRHRPDNFDAVRLVGRFDNWCLFAASGILTLFLLRNLRSSLLTAEMPATALFVMGLMTWVFPGVPIALSPRYQDIVKTGIGYLPVYMQYFGVAMIVVAGLLWLAKTTSAHWYKFALGLCIANAGIAMLTFDTNRTVVERIRRDMDTDARQNIEAALKAGLCDEVPADTTLMVANWHFWLNSCMPPNGPSNFFSQHMGRKVNVVSTSPTEREPTLSEQLEKLPVPTFLVSDQSLGAGTCFVLLGSIEPRTDIPIDDPYGAREFRIFIRGKLLTKVQNEPSSLVSQIMPASDDPLSQRPQAVRFSDLTLLRRGGDWAIYQGSFEHPADVATVRFSHEPETTLLAEARR